MLASNASRPWRLQQLNLLCPLEQIPTTTGRSAAMSGKNKGGREIRKPKQPKPLPVATPGKPRAAAGG